MRRSDLLIAPSILSAFLLAGCGSAVPTSNAPPTPSSAVSADAAATAIQTAYKREALISQRVAQAKGELPRNARLLDHQVSRVILASCVEASHGSIACVATYALDGQMFFGRHARFFKDPRGQWQCQLAGFVRA